MNDQLNAFFDRMRQEFVNVTYGEVRLYPQHSDVTASDPSIDLGTRITRNVRLKMPIVSSPMDTVTTARMAIAMAEAGGLGVIHRGLSPAAQAKEVVRVKHWLNRRVETPITVRDDLTVKEVLTMLDEKKYPFQTLPVVNPSGWLVGLLGRRDFDSCDDTSMLVTKIMTPLADLIVGGEGVTAQEAYEVMVRHKKSVLPLVRADGTLAHLYLFSDVKRIHSPTFDHNVDSNGQLVVAAAVGVGQGARERAALLARAKCDFFHIDTAHGDSANVCETIRFLKREYPHVDVLAGNVSRGDAAKRLVEWGADGVGVGQGPGSICTTRIVAGIGVPQVSAVYDCVRALERTGVPVCADGGINSSGDMVIALALGASTVMLGRLLAATEEAPGESWIYKGVRVKGYRGMGSLGAMRDNASSRERYGQGGADSAKLVPEGGEAAVPLKGSVRAELDQYLGGIRSGMAYQGARTLARLHEVAEIFRMSAAGQSESHMHDVMMTVEPPNYSGRT